MTASTPISYRGATGMGTPPKWTHAQLGAASGRTTTPGTASDAVPEHLFRFTSVNQGLKVSVTAGGSQEVGVSVFQSATEPLTHSTLAPTAVQTSHNSSAYASVSGTYNGTYYVLVHGSRNEDFGDYTLSIESSGSSGPQSGGNFTEAALNVAGTPASYADFGTLASRAASYSGRLSTATQLRWSSDQVATADSSKGCRDYDGTDSYAQAFKFRLNSPTNLLISLATQISNLDGVVSVFGPITSWGAGTLGVTGADAAATFNGGTALSVRTCQAVADGSKGAISAAVYPAGDYLVLVHSTKRNQGTVDDDRTGTYTLTLAPQAGLQTGGNFSNSALGGSSPVAQTGSDFAKTWLDTSGTPAKYGNFGTVGTAAVSYSGALAGTTQKRWSSAQVGTGSSVDGCRAYAGANSYEQAFRFNVSSPKWMAISLATQKNKLDAVVSVFGPIASWGSATPGVTGADPAATFNGGAALAVRSCVAVLAGQTRSIGPASYAAGDYLVLVHGEKDNVRAKGNYTLTLEPRVAPYADFGALGGTKIYVGSLKDVQVRKWTGGQLATASESVGCRVNAAARTNEHAFKFRLDDPSEVVATLENMSGSGGVLSVFGPIVGWNAGADIPKTATVVANYNSPASMAYATCNDVNLAPDTTSGTIARAYPAGDYLVLVHGKKNDNDKFDYSLSLSATGSPYAANSQNALLDGTTTAVFADLQDVTSVGYTYEGSTASATQKWSNSHLDFASCRSNSDPTARDSVREHLFKFNIASDKVVKLTLRNPGATGSSWDSALSVFGPATATPSVGLPIMGPRTCTQTVGADDFIQASLTGPGTYYALVHGDTDSDSGSYVLRVEPQGLSIAPNATWPDDSMNTSLDGVGIAPVADFGLMGGSALYYKGATTGSISKWTGTQLATSVAATGATVAANGCRFAGATATGEPMFSFTLGSSRFVSVNVSPSGFDPVLSVIGPLSVSPSVGAAVGSGATVRSCYHNSANAGTAVNGTATVSGTWAAGTYYVTVHGYATTANVALAKPTGSYTLTLDPTLPSAPTPRMVATDNTTAESAQAAGATAINLGAADNFITTYAGATALATTTNKWTDAQIRSASTAITGTGAATGCRASGSQDNGHEHLFKFTVTKAGGLPLRAALAGTLDGSLSIYANATAPSSGATVTTLVACSRNGLTASDAVSDSYTASGGVVSGTFPPGTYFGIVHGYGAADAGAYTLTLTDNTTTYTSASVATTAAADVSGPQAGLSLGGVDGKLISYTGDTTAATMKWTQAQVATAGNTGCRAAGNDLGREHLLKFTVATARRVALRLSLPGSGPYAPVISVFSGGTPSIGAAIPSLSACSRLGSSAVADNVATTGFTASNGLVTGNFAAGTYYVLVHGYGATNNGGAYNLAVFDAQPEAMGEADVGHRVTIEGNTSVIPFNAWEGGNFPVANSVSHGGRFSAEQRTGERLYSFVVSGAPKMLTVSVSALFDSVLSVFDTLPTAVSAGAPGLTGLLETQRNSGSYLRSITRSFAPGTYYVMVHGYRSSDAPNGAFTLAVGDDHWQDGLMACSSLGASSKLTAVNLSAGSYYLVVKSGAGTGQMEATYRYVLSARRTFAQPFIACNHEGFGPGTRRGFIETTLQGGKTYAVVVRGVTPSDEGTYGVSIHDLTAGNAPLGCANAAGYTGAANNPNSFTADLKADHEYHVVVRSNGDGASSVGHSNVRISHSSTAMCAYNNVTFDTVGNSSTSSPVPAQIVATLAPGDYYAVVKGNGNLSQSTVNIPTGTDPVGVPNDRGRGRYQITFGDATLATNNQQYTPPVWGTRNSGGAYNELAAQGIRVITVNSISKHGSSDLYMREPWVIS